MKLTVLGGSGAWPTAEQGCSGYVDHVPDDSAGYLSSARAMGEVAAAAGVRHLVLTHLWPGTDPIEARAAAAREFSGRITVAAAGLNLWV